MKIWIEKELFQWEKNRYVYVDIGQNESLPDFIQFYNNKVSYGPEVRLIENKAKIPDYLLKDCLPIMALACNGEEGKTQVIDRRQFKVLKRTKPENYIDDSEEENSHIIYDGGEEK